MSTALNTGFHIHNGARRAETDNWNRGRVLCKTQPKQGGQCERWVNEAGRVIASPTDCCAVYFAINKVGTTDMWTVTFGVGNIRFDVAPTHPLTFHFIGMMRDGNGVFQVNCNISNDCRYV